MFKIFIFFITMTFFFSLQSCGKKTESKSYKASDRVCSTLDCLATADWKISLPGRSFPHKTRVSINGMPVVDECISKQKHSINRSTDPQSLYLENFLVPKRGELKIEIFDLGHNCDSESLFSGDNDVEFKFTKTKERALITVSL
jgi:hypothetical protein